VICQTPLPWLITSAPRCRKISAMNRISLRSGTLRMVHVPDVRSVAAKMGRAAFLAPPTVTSPESLRRPSIRSTSMIEPSDGRVVGVRQGHVVTRWIGAQKSPGPFGLRGLKVLLEPGVSVSRRAWVGCCHRPDVSGSVLRPDALDRPNRSDVRAVADGVRHRGCRNRIAAWGRDCLGADCAKG